jgi:tryptophan synthase alpha chain
LEAIFEAQPYFIYLVSTPGVTGARKDLSAQLEGVITNLKNQTDIPVLVGFGVSDRAHVDQIRDAGANGVIVGSALVKLIEEGKAGEIGELMGTLV